MKSIIYGMLRSNIKDVKAILLLAAFVLALVAAVMRPIQMKQTGFDILAVVDITGSMNTRDYTIGGTPVSRLSVAKSALKKMLVRLPCSSRIALALFTERVPFLLFEPVDICKNYGALEKAVEAIDWREAWEGDSHIATAYYRAIDMAKSVDSNLLFITDGQEAPPLPLSGAPIFEGRKGDVGGLILGAGGYALSPIPKFDDRGNEIGFWSVDDVPHESRFGPPPVDAEHREGYEARNAPFGAVAPKGTEHLSSVREAYLKKLANETGLAYAHMTETSDIAAELKAVARPHIQQGTYDAGWIPGLLSLICLSAGFLIGWLKPETFIHLKYRTREVR